MLPLTLDKLPRGLLANLDLETVFKASRCVIAAERLQLFRKLDGKELTAAEIGRRVGLHQNQRETFLNILAALGLLVRKGRRYRVSAVGRKHFVTSRGMHWTRLWSQYCADDYSALSVLEKSLTTGRDYRKILGIKRPGDYDILRVDQKWADDFTNIMHDTKREQSRKLAERFDLSSYSALLDIGGGSGVMSMAMVRKHTNLKACVLELEPVCRAARKIIRHEGLSNRVKTLPGDFTRAIPKGFDVMMFWDVGAIPLKSIKLAYRSLPRDGLLIIGGCFTGKEDRSINLLTRELTLVYPPHLSWQETVANVKAACFAEVKRQRVKDTAWIIRGYKRSRKT